MATVVDVYSEVKDMILEVKDFEEEEIKPETTFSELELDSLDFVELMVTMKKEFGVTLQSEVFSNGQVTNLDQMCEYVVGLMDAPA